MMHDCGDDSCKYNFDSGWCDYNRLWNKELEGYDGCGGSHTQRDKLARALRKKRGQVLLATSRSTGFDYVSRLGLLYDCLQRGRSFHEYGYDDESP